MARARSAIHAGPAAYLRVQFAAALANPGFGHELRQLASEPAPVE
ncbi:hypothetical protein ABZW30_40925 [Kitasatospora sp. NPDC004669]